MADITDRISDHQGLRCLLGHVDAAANFAVQDSSSMSARPSRTVAATQSAAVCPW
jgi:hypothetical protein